MIDVLVVDDDFRVAQVHAGFVDACPDFRVAGSANTVAQAKLRIAELKPTLMLVDVYLPDGSGLDLLRDTEVDCFVLSAADDPATVRRAFRFGAVQYLIKPFSSDELRARLLAYRRFDNTLRGEHLDQRSIDDAARALVPTATTHTGRPSSATEKLVLTQLQTARYALSATEVANQLGIARATAQRYLGQLAESGAAKVGLRYGSTGRPEHEYFVIEQR